MAKGSSANCVLCPHSAWHVPVLWISPLASDFVPSFYPSLLTTYQIFNSSPLSSLCLSLFLSPLFLIFLSSFICLGVGFGLFLFFFFSEGGGRQGKDDLLVLSVFSHIPSCFSVVAVHVRMTWILILSFSFPHPFPLPSFFFCLLSYFQIIFAWVCQRMVSARSEAPSILSALCSFHGCWMYGCSFFPVGIIIIVLVIMYIISFCSSCLISFLGGGDGSEGRAGVGVRGTSTACTIHDTCESRPFFFPT